MNDRPGTILLTAPDEPEDWLTGTRAFARPKVVAAGWPDADIDRIIKEERKAVQTRRTPLEMRLEKRIARASGDVFLRADFDGLGSYSQVGRVLRTLVRKGRLIKLGYGLYARTRESPLTGKPQLPKGLGTVAEALRRLGIETAPSRAQQDYNTGRTEQVPTGRVMGIRGKRLRRRIGYNGILLSFERVQPERPARPTPCQPRGPAPATPITVGTALRLIWEADRYPILGNEDLRASLRMETEAREKAALAVPSPGDPPEFARWLAALLDPALPEDQRDDVLGSLYDLFDPERD